MIRYLLGLFLIGLTACATGPRIDEGPGPLPMPTWGWNIGAGDLLNPATAACRLGVYLDELSTQGYAKRVRILYSYEWGPFVRDVWIPIIRAKGYRILVVLSQHPGDKDVARLETWIRQGLPAIADILDGVHLANEPDGYSGMTPTQYTDWHRQIAAIVRQVVPEVPILSPDFRGVGEWNSWVMRTQLDYGRDYDAVSLHVTHVTRESDLQTYVNDVQRWTGHFAGAHLDGRTDGGTDLPDLPTPRVWVTEGDWGQQAWFSAHGLPIERSYIYLWNCNPTHPGSPACEPETRRPQGMTVDQCGGQYGR